MDLKACLRQLGWSQKGFAEAIDYRDETVSRWCTGKAEVPRVVRLYVGTMLALVAIVRTKGAQD